MDFNRNYAIPSGSTWPKFPTGLDSWGQSGKPQLRTTAQAGRTWEEMYPPIKANSPNTRAFIAYINKLWRSRTIFTILHPHLETPIGVPIDNMYIYGANQTGTTLQVTKNSSGAQTNVSGTLKAGDIIKIGNYDSTGINLIFDVTEDVSNFSSVSISPPLISGMNFNSYIPIYYTGVKFRVTLVEGLTLPSASYDTWYEGLRLLFRECP